LNSKQWEINGVEGAEEILEVIFFDTHQAFAPAWGGGQLSPSRQPSLGEKNLPGDPPLNKVFLGEIVLRPRGE